jgi:hypothetical protein
MSAHFSQLNQLSISAIRSLFKTLDPPDAASLIGLYRGLFVGPGWLRASAEPLLAITGLGGWWGKEFDPAADCGAINLIKRRGEYHRVFPMDFVQQPSYLDGRPGLALCYRRDNPFPWPLVIDELRRIDDNTMLGMTLVDRRVLRRQPFPFILHRREALDPL